MMYDLVVVVVGVETGCHIDNECRRGHIDLLDL